MRNTLFTGEITMDITQDPMTSIEEKPLFRRLAA